MLNNPEGGFTNLAGCRNGEPGLPLKRSLEVFSNFPVRKKLEACSPHIASQSLLKREVYARYSCLQNSAEKIPLKSWERDPWLCIFFFIFMKNTLDTVFTRCTPKSPHSFSLYFKKISAIKWEVAVIFKVWPQNQHYLETC